jgi:hypothetical protein
MTDIKSVLPSDAATIDQIQSKAGFQASAGAVKFREHLTKEQGQLSDAWSALGWYEKNTASFALLAAKTIQSGYGVNTLSARLQVLALLKIIRPTGSGGRMPKAPPEGSPFGDLWPHQRLGYRTWGEFVLGPAAGLSGPDGAYIKGPGLGFGQGIRADDPEADKQRERALAYERDLFRGYERLMDLLPESALPHTPEDICSHFRASFGGELTVDAIEDLGKSEKHGACPTVSRTRRLAQDPAKAAVTVQKAAQATKDPEAYIRQIVEVISPAPPTTADCIAELIQRYDRQFLKDLALALGDYLDSAND